MEILPYIHVERRQTMEKSLMTEILEANRETKREERFGRDRWRDLCICVCVLSVNEEGQPVKRERDIWTKWVFTHKNPTIQLVGPDLKQYVILATRASEARFTGPKSSL